MSGRPRLIALIGPEDPPAPTDFLQALHRALHRRGHDQVHLGARAAAALTGTDLARPDLSRPDLCLLWRPVESDAPSTPHPQRQALLDAGLPHCVLAGPLDRRVDAAVAAWEAQLRAEQADGNESAEPLARWRHACARCGDGDCERALFDLGRARGR